MTRKECVKMEAKFIESLKKYNPRETVNFMNLMIRHKTSALTQIKTFRKITI